MVELRWIERPLFNAPKTLPDGITGGPVPNVCVLQYRSLLGEGVDEQGWHSARWSDWRDVPKVLERMA